MQYLINKETKEHIAYKPCHDHMNSVVWRIVQADSDGWVPHKGDVCPLPEDVPCQIRIKTGSVHSHVREACGWDWAHDNYNAITAYRPILEPVQEPEPVPEPQYDPRSVSFNLLDRLKAAHAQAQAIPDLEAELREVLGGMGYDLVSRSPFVKAEAEPDMTDWLNWREGDKVQYFGYTDSFKGSDCFIGAITDGLFKIHKAGTEYFTWASPHEIRFHSRPLGE
jgi:hypothetical protein